MKKKSILKKVTILLCTFSFFIFQSAYSQCDNPVPTGDSAQIFCDIDQPTIGDLVTNEITIAWFDAPTGGNQLIVSTKLQDGHVYYADNNFGGGCSPSRLEVTVTINGFPPQTFPVVGQCSNQNPTINDIPVIGTDIKWYDAEFGGNLLNGTDLLENGKQYWAEQTIDGCTSARSVTNVLLIAPPTPTTPTEQDFCSIPTPTVADLQANDTDPNSEIFWYDSETSTTSLSPSTLLISGRQYWASVTNTTGCESASRIVTTVTIDIAPNAGISGIYPDCEINSNVDLFDYLGGDPDKTGTWTGPPGSNLSNGYLGTFDPFLNFEGVYTYTVKSDLGVCDDAIATVTIELVVPPTPEPVQVLCEIDNPTIGSIQVPGTNIKYYDTETSAPPLDPSSPLVDGDYWVTQTDVNGCESSPRVMVEVTINAPEAPTTTTPSVIFCEIEDKTIADLSVNVNGTNIQWYDTETSTTPLSDTTLLVPGDYWATQTDDEGCESKLRLEVTVAIDTTPPPTTASQDQKFCLNDFAPVTPKVSDLDITGDGIKWYDTETSTTPLNDSDDLEDGDYWATQTDVTTGCESKLRTLVNVELLDPLNATGEPNQVFCLADNPTIADIIVTGDTIIWYETENSSTPLDITEILVDATDYWALNTLLGCESTTRLKVTVEILDALPPVIAEPTQSFCGSKFPTITDLTPSENILWFASETSDTPLTDDELLVDGTTYWAATNDPDNNCVSSIREPVDVTLFLPVPPTGDENQVFCEIQDATIANLIVVGDDIRWYASETSTTPLESTELLIDGTSYWAAQITSIDDCESQRLMVNVTINVTPPPTTANPSQTFCEVNNSTIADISIDDDENIIKWYADETSTTELSETELLVDGTQYWATQTDTTTGCESKSRLSITVTIISVLDATATETVQTFCIGNNPTITDLNILGDLILWYDSETSTDILPYTTPLVDGQEYWALNTDSTTGCISPNRIKIDVVVQDIVNSLIVPTEQEFCAMDSPTVANLAPSTNAIWYASETDPSALENTVILTNDLTYWAAEIDETTGCISSVRFPSKVILDIGIPPTTTEPTQTFCEIENATISNLAIDGIDIIWYETETSTTVLDPTTILENGIQYWASQTNPCESIERLMISVIINSTPAPTSPNEIQVFCLTEYSPNNPTVADLTATGNTIIWYESETATIPLDSSETLINNEDYWATQTDAVTGCISKLRLKISASIIDPLPASGEADQSFCQADNPTVSNIVVTGDTIVWYDSETSTTPLDNTAALEDGKSYWALNTELGCESSTRFMVTIIIQDALPPTTEPNQTFCISDSPTINDLQVVGIVNWYATETDTTPLDGNELLKDNSYWAATIDNTIGCISSVRVATLVKLIDPGTPTLSSDGDKFCKVTNPTLGDLDANVSPANNGLISWYDSYPNGNALGLSDFLIDGDTYYALETDFNGCISIIPLEVTVDLNACEEYDIIIYDGFSPNGDGINDTFTVGNLEILYPDYKIEFFNRWGDAVFSTNSEHKTWNGRLKGDKEFVPAGVYYYIIHFNKDDRKPVQYSLYLSR